MKDVFCRIIDREIPSTRLYEDEDVLAILDISQTTRGHALVMPKKHCESMLSCPQEILNKVMFVAKKIGQVEMSALGAKGINILANCGEAAGQTVPHFHVHVIPRYGEEEEGFRLIMESHDTPSSNLLSLAKDIADAINE